MVAVPLKDPFTAWIENALKRARKGLEKIAKDIGEVFKTPAEGEEDKAPEAAAAASADILGKFHMYPTPTSPTAAAQILAAARDRGDDAAWGQTWANVGAELASFGQLDVALEGFWRIPGSRAVYETAFEGHMARYKYSIQPLLKRYYQGLNQPFLADPQSLIRLYIGDGITSETYAQLMKEHGFDYAMINILTAAAFRIPDVGTLLDLRRRNFIDDTTLLRSLRRAQFPADLAAQTTKLVEQLPAYQDMISVYMREGYLEEKWAEIPSEFINYIKQLGFSEFWAYRLWGKHWVLPGVNLLYDMFHKEIIDYDTMAQMLKYHDFEPVWRARLIENAYVMIPRVDLRRAYRYGVMGYEDLKTRYGWIGYRETDATIMAGIAERFALDRYYGRLETVARAAYRKGQLEEAGLRDILARINTPALAVDLIIEAETIAREAGVLEVAEEPRTLTASQILRMYAARILTKEGARSRLVGAGVEPADAALLIELYEPRPDVADVNRDLVTAASMLYREGLMDPEEYQGRLRKAGLTAVEIQDRIEAEDLRYRLDYARDLIALVKEAYEKDVYTLEEAEDRLLAYDMQPERAAALMALEQLKKLPKLKA